MKSILSALVLVIALPLGCTKSCNNKSMKNQTGSDRVVVSDLQRFEVQIGNGELAEAGKQAEVHYTLMTARGKIVKSTRADNAPETIAIIDSASREKPLGYYVHGMKEGGRRRVTVPWGKEYGNEHESQEPLIFEIELLKVTSK